MYFRTYKIYSEELWFVSLCNVVLNNEKHLFDYDFQILHLACKGGKLSWLEKVEINKCENPNTLSNSQVDFLHDSPLINYLSNNWFLGKK